MSRRTLDFYETPEWQTRALLKRLRIEGAIYECCSGDGSLVRALKVGREGGARAITTNDLDPARTADRHHDATSPEAWDEKFDWVITNPPFNAAFAILQHAVQHAHTGVVMLLRITFLEPTRDRSDWLSLHPPSAMFVLPRWSYKQNGRSDSVTTAWFYWNTRAADHLGLQTMSIVPLSEKGLV